MQHQSNSISYIGILIALISLFFSYNSNEVSKRSNEISTEANDLSKEAISNSKFSINASISKNNYDKEISSYEIVDEAFEEVYDDQSVRKVIDQLKNDTTVTRHDDFRKFIDVLENLGSKYCKGLVNRDHLIASFSRTFDLVCQNEQVFEKFSDNKNATALLCYDFKPNSKFATAYDTSTYNTCLSYNINEENLED